MDSLNPLFFKLKNINLSHLSHKTCSHTFTSLYLHSPELVHHLLGFWYPNALRFGTWSPRTSPNQAEQFTHLPHSLKTSCTCLNNIFLFIVFSGNSHPVFLYNHSTASSPHAVTMPKHCAWNLYLLMNFYSFQTTLPVWKDHSKQIPCFSFSHTLVAFTPHSVLRGFE